VSALWSVAQLDTTDGVSRRAFRLFGPGQALAWAVMSSPAQPTVLADRYELGDVLGRGGMAEVYLAHDRRLGRTVAVKVMRADLVDKADFVARFGKEARSVAALNHPTVVAVYDSGEARLPPGAGAVDPQR